MYMVRPFDISMGREGNVLFCCNACPCDSWVSAERLHLALFFLIDASESSSMKYLRYMLVLTLQ